MYAYVLVRSTICETCTICKIQENANITNIQCVAQIELCQIVHSICQIVRSTYATQLLFAQHGHTIRYEPKCLAFLSTRARSPNFCMGICLVTHYIA